MGILRDEARKLSGSLRVDATASGCRRIDEATIEADVFGLRGALERVFEKSTKDNWTAAAAYVRSHL